MGERKSRSENCQMKCSNCGLENPPSALRCDCGFNFDKGVVDPEYAQQQKITGKYQMLIGKIETRPDALKTIKSWSNGFFLVAGVQAAFAIFLNPWNVADASA